MNTFAKIAFAASAAAFAGCIHVTTESEVKPIHITMDVNLKVDKELDRAFADETSASPKGDFRLVRDLVDRKAAGIDAKAMLVAMDGASDDDRLAIAEANARRLKRFSEIAKSNGVALEKVQTRHAAQMLARIPEGSGVWYEKEDGGWARK